MLPHFSLEDDLLLELFGLPNEKTIETPFGNHFIPFFSVR